MWLISVTQLANAEYENPPSLKASKLLAQPLVSLQQLHFMLYVASLEWVKADKRDKVDESFTLSLHMGKLEMSVQALHRDAEGPGGTPIMESRQAQPLHFLQSPSLIPSWGTQRDFQIVFVILELHLYLLLKNMSGLLKQNWLDAHPFPCGTISYSGRFSCLESLDASTNKSSHYFKL